MNTISQSSNAVRRTLAACLFFCDLSASPAATRSSVLRQDLGRGERPAAGTLWQDNLGGSEHPSPPSSSLEDRIECSFEGAFGESPSKSFESRLEEARATSAKSPILNNGRRNRSSPTWRSPLKEGQKSSGILLLKDSERGESPVLRVVQQNLPSSGFLSLPSTREIVRSDTSFQFRGYAAENNDDGDCWVTNFGFGTEDTNIVMPECGKCSHILRHVPGSEVAYWIHVQCQVLEQSNIPLWPPYDKSWRIFIPHSVNQRPFNGFSLCPWRWLNNSDASLPCQGEGELCSSLEPHMKLYNGWDSESKDTAVHWSSEKSRVCKPPDLKELIPEEFKDHVSEESTYRGLSDGVKQRTDAKKSTHSDAPNVDTKIEMLPRVMIVGRPNVGKSALFNRLTKRREALVYNTPQGHVTRDIREGVAKIGDLRFVVCDTAGLETEADSDNVLIRTAGLTAAAFSQCHLALFLLDGRAGLQPWDTEVGKWLRKQNVSIPVVLIVNKAEGLLSDATGMLLSTIGEAHSLGFGDPIPISAETGEGLTDLYATLRPLLIEAQDIINSTTEVSLDETYEGSLPLQLAIAGRPNVGKSTILNSLLRQERVLTGPEPGLTRDAVRVKFKYDSETVYLVDTAGWMQRAQLSEGPMALSAMHARRSLMRSNIVVLVLDGEEVAKARKSMLQSEVALARWVTQEGRGLVVVVNKMDTLKGKDQAELRNKVMKAVPEEINNVLPQVEGIPIIFVSALEGKGRAAIMRKVFESYKRWNVRIPTAKLNNWLQKVLSRHPRKAEGGYGAKMRYITQVKARPPTFIVFVTGAGDIEETDLRFVASALREDFDLGGIPIRVIPRHTRRGLRAQEVNKSRPRKVLSTKSQGSQLPSSKRTGTD